MAPAKSGAINFLGSSCDKYLLILLLSTCTLATPVVVKGSELVSMEFCDNIKTSSDTYPPSIVAQDGAKYPFWIHCHQDNSMRNSSIDKSYAFTFPSTQDKVLELQEDRYRYLKEIAQKCKPQLSKLCGSFQLGLLSHESKECPTCGLNDLNCDNVHQCTNECGQVKSINYPSNYVNNYRCRWSISAPSTYYVNLSIIDFDIPSSNNATKLGTCIFDYLTLIDGYTGKRLGCYCNENLPPQYIVSPWNELIIQFDTNSETTGRGFYFQYKFMKLELSERIKHQLRPGIEGNDANNSIVCLHGWQYFRGNCYKAYNDPEPLQWYDAENNCSAHGKGLDGHLVSILDRDEMLVIQHFLTNVWVSPRYSEYYIGLIDVSREGVYRWSDNNPMSYTDWQLKPILMEEEMQAQPDGGAYEDCTIIRYNSFSRTSNWHDVPCSLGKHYHSHLEKSTQMSINGLDHVSSYICKSDSISFAPLLRTSIRRPLYLNEFTYSIQVGHLISNIRSNTSKFYGGVNLTALHQANQLSPAELNRLYLSELDDNRYFVCNNLEVISVVLRCDGVAHCRDGSDESNGCNKDCLDWQFKCSNGQCIAIGSYCDFIADCGDGSDEYHCERLRCKKNEFKCQSGQCIMSQQKCDLLPDCADSSDEGKLCAIGGYCNPNSAFKCYNGNCIPQYVVCDYQIDCPGKFHEDEDAATCELVLKNRSLDHKVHLNNYQSSPVAYYIANQESTGVSGQNQFRCSSGNIIDNSLRCLYEFDRYGYQIGCRDVTHLIDCAHFECPSRDYVKCSNSYCIPWRYICDGKWDCIMGEDEVGCARYVCPGQYKCANQSSCILLHQLCDGFRQCPMGDDEWFCDLQCPAQCDCIGQFVNCHGASLTQLPTNYISKSVRKLDLSLNHLGPNLSNCDFSTFSNLGELNLQHNEIEVLQTRKYSQLRNLYKLDLSNNKIHSVKRGAFAGLRRVTQLSLENNPVVILEPEAFLGLSSLQVLNISSSQIQVLRKNTFDGLTSLRQLLLRSNMITEIEDGAFRSLESLVSLDLRGNEIRHFTKLIFSEFKSLRNLSTDSFKFCCLMNHQIPADRCLPLPDEISDCEDLLSSLVQRTCIWIAGVVACIGNSIVVVWRYKDRFGVKREEKDVNSALLLSLGCSDLLMGIYLIIIAIADSWYRGRYIENADNWRESNLCVLCGFLSTVSSLVSVFTLVSIAYNRYTVLCHPFDHASKLTTDFIYTLIGISWTIAITLALLPLLIKSYFQGQFYTRSGVCLAFHITNQKPPGWQYSIVLFQFLNLVAFLIIVGYYTRVYRQISSSEHGQTHQVRIALVVITSFAAWSPTIILRLISLAGITLPAAVYSWIAVLVLPVNSAINPMIYTIPSIKRQIRLHRKDDTYLQATERRNQLAKRNVPVGHLTLSQYISQSGQLNVGHLIMIALEIAKDIEAKHKQPSSKIYKTLTADNVFVSETIELSDNNKQGRRLQVFISDYDGYDWLKPCTTGESQLSKNCQCRDVKRFGEVVVKLIKLYNKRTITNKGHQSLLWQQRVNNSEPPT